MTTVEWRQARGATGCCGYSPTPRCSSRRMSMWRSGSPRWRRSPTRRSRWRWRWRCGRCATGRCAWTCGRSSSRSVSTGLPWPDVDEWLAAVAGEPAGRDAAGAAARRRSAVPRPVLARGAAGVRRRADDGRDRQPKQVSSGHRSAVSRGVRGAARRGESRTVARVDGADRRPGYGQDDDGGAAAGVACRRHPAADRAGGTDGQGGGAAAGGGAAGGRQAGRRRPDGAVGAACDDAAPAARAAGRTRRRGSATTAATGCRTT